MKEIWENIAGFDGKYQVSTWGRIRSASGILKPYQNAKGYLKIDLYKNGVRYKKRVHRLVASTFIPNPYNDPEVNHIDGNKQNNSITNLEWVSDYGNRLHETQYAAKVTEDIKWIKQRRTYDYYTNPI